MPNNTKFLRFARALGARSVFLGAAMLGLVGCSILPKPVEDPTRYYLLAADAGAGDAPSNSGRSLHLAIRVVELPGYLRNNRTMVIRRGANEIAYQDYARWAEPLDTAVQRIVRDRLLASADVATAEVAPLSPSIERDYDITVRVLRCEGYVNEAGKKSAQFVAVYEIADRRNEGKIVVRKQYSAPERDWDGANFGVLAQYLSDSVMALGEQILADIPK
jgi:uncharacterized lipoprotein YmbA